MQSLGIGSLVSFNRQSLLFGSNQARQAKTSGTDKTRFASSVVAKTFSLQEQEEMKQFIAAHLALGKKIIVTYEGQKSPLSDKKSEVNCVLGGMNLTNLQQMRAGLQLRDGQLVISNEGEGPIYANFDPQNRNKLYFIERLWVSQSKAHVVLPGKSLILTDDHVIDFGDPRKNIDRSIPVTELKTLIKQLTPRIRR